MDTSRPMAPATPAASWRRRPWRWLLLPVDLLLLSFDLLRIIAWYVPAWLAALVGLGVPPDQRVFLPCVQDDWIEANGEKQRTCQPGRKYANPWVAGLLCSGVQTAVVGERGVCVLCRRYGNLGVAWPRLLGVSLVVGALWGLAGVGTGLLVRSRFQPSPATVEGNPLAPAAASLTAATAADESPVLTDLVSVRSDLDAPPEPTSEALVLLSESALAMGKRDEARAAAEKALLLAPDDPRSRVQMAHVEMAEGHLDAAAQAYRQILAGAPTQVEAGAGLARVLLAQGDAKAAMAQAQTVLHIAPQNVEAAAALAAATLASGDRATATELYAKLNREHPAEFEPAARYADLLLRAGKANEALTVARKLVAERPGEADPQVVLGDAYLRANLPDLALECCQSALRSRPQAILPHVLLARAHMAKGNSAAAARELEGLLKLAPDDAGLTLALATCREAAGKLDEAAALCQSAAAARPDAVAPWLRLARLQVQAGRSDEALASSRQAVAAAPDNPLALNALATLLLEQDGGVAEAFALATRAHELAPQRPLITDTLAWACHLQRDHARALELLGQARGGLPRNALIRYHYAAVLAALGRSQEAARELVPVLALSTFRYLAAAQALNADLQARLSSAPAAGSPAPVPSASPAPRPGDPSTPPPE